MKKRNNNSKSILALVAFGLVFSGAAKAGDTEFSGFAAPTFTWSNQDASNLGFHVGDGAVYVMHKEGKAKVMVDLPFSYSSTAGSFNFAMTKAQAYVHVSYDNGVNWRLGQWDRLNGLEAVDDNGIPFTSHGFVDNSFSSVKAGATLGYDGGSWSADLLFNNPMSLTSHNNSGNRNYEIGLHTDWLKGKSFELGIGAIAYNKVYTFDAIFSFGLGNLDFDLEAVVQTGGTDTGFGVLAQAISDFTDMISGGIRLEYGNKLATAGSRTATNKSEFAITVGPQFKVTKAMKLKVDYTFDSSTPYAGGTSTKTSTASVGAVYSF